MAFFQQSGASDIAKTPGSAVKVAKEKETTVAEANRSRLSLEMTNDSENTIYVFKGKGAKIKEGIRLNKEGGSYTINDYTGIVTAAATGESVLGFTEV